MITYEIYTNMQYKIMNFVAYEGPRGVRITVVAKLTQAQKQWFFASVKKEFNLVDQTQILECFGAAVGEFEKKIQSGMTYGNSPSSLAATMPGAKEIVKHPVSKKDDTLMNVIISLNDSHGWTREKIADWVETLDIDIRFKVDDDGQQSLSTS